MIPDMRHHQYADLFPMLDRLDASTLADAIKTEGLLHPIVLLDGQILDGRNRYRACQELNIKPKFVEYRGSDPLGFVIAMNLRRRHLTESQRAMVAAKIATLRHGQKTSDAQICATETQSNAGDQLKVSRRSVQSAREVIDHGTAELADAVESGDVPVSVAAEVSRLSEYEQNAVVNAGPDAIRRAAAEIREKKRRDNERAHDNATKAFSKWVDKYRFLGDDDLRDIISEVLK
jgi:hypothetical protein